MCLHCPSFKMTTSSLKYATFSKRPFQVTMRRIMTMTIAVTVTVVMVMKMVVMKMVPTRRLLMKMKNLYLPDEQSYWKFTASVMQLVQRLPKLRSHQDLSNNNNSNKSSFNRNNNRICIRIHNTIHIMLVPLEEDGPIFPHSLVVVVLLLVVVVVVYHRLVSLD